MFAGACEGILMFSKFRLKLLIRPWLLAISMAVVIGDVSVSKYPDYWSNIGMMFLPLSSGS